MNKRESMRMKKLVRRKKRVSKGNPGPEERIAFMLDGGIRIRMAEFNAEYKKHAPKEV